MQIKYRCAQDITMQYCNGFCAVHANGSAIEPILKKKKKKQMQQQFQHQTFNPHLIRVHYIHIILQPRRDLVRFVFFIRL